MHDVDLHHWGVLATHSTSQQLEITMVEPQTEIPEQEEDPTTFPTPFPDFEEQQAQVLDLGELPVLGRPDVVWVVVAPSFA